MATTTNPQGSIEESDLNGMSLRTPIINEELQEVGDASMYEYSKEEMDQILEDAGKERIVKNPIHYNEKHR